MITDDQKAEFILDWILHCGSFSIDEYTAMLKNFCRVLNLFIKGQDRITRIFKEGSIAVVRNDGFLNAPHLYVVNGDSKFKINRLAEFATSIHNKYAYKDSVYFLDFDKYSLISIYDDMYDQLGEDIVNIKMITMKYMIHDYGLIGLIKINYAIDDIGIYKKSEYAFDAFESIERKSSEVTQVFRLEYIYYSTIPRYIDSLGAMMLTKEIKEILEGLQNNIMALKVSFLSEVFQYSSYNTKDALMNDAKGVVDYYTVPYGIATTMDIDYNVVSKKLTDLVSYSKYVIYNTQFKFAVIVKCL